MPPIPRFFPILFGSPGAAGHCDHAAHALPRPVHGVVLPPQPAVPRHPGRFETGNHNHQSLRRQHASLCLPQPAAPWQPGNLADFLAAYSSGQQKSRCCLQLSLCHPVFAAHSSQRHPPPAWPFGRRTVLGTRKAISVLITEPPFCCVYCTPFLAAEGLCAARGEWAGGLPARHADLHPVSLLVCSLALVREGCNGLHWPARHAGSSERSGGAAFYFTGSAAAAAAGLQRRCSSIDLRCTLVWSTHDMLFATIPAVGTTPRGRASCTACRGTTPRRWPPR